jgi:hypothetical protein
LRFGVSARGILDAGMSGSSDATLNSSERARRNAEMAARRALGATWAEVAAEFGVAKSTAREGVRQHLEAGASVRVVGAAVVRPADLDVGRIFADVVTTHIEVMADLGRLAEEADNSAAKVGALKGRAQAGDRLVAILGAAGLLPCPNEVLLARARRVRARSGSRR